MKGLRKRSARERERESAYVCGFGLKRVRSVCVGEFG